jgi:hypothetical protein
MGRRILSFLIGLATEKEEVESIITRFKEFQEAK